MCLKASFNNGRLAYIGQQLAFLHLDITSLVIIKLLFYRCCFLFCMSHPVDSPIPCSHDLNDWILCRHLVHNKRFLKIHYQVISSNLQYHSSFFSNRYAVNLKIINLLKRHRVTDLISADSV